MYAVKSAGLIFSALVQKENFRGHFELKSEAGLRQVPVCRLFKLMLTLKTPASFEISKGWNASGLCDTFRT